MRHKFVCGLLHSSFISGSVVIHEVLYLGFVDIQKYPVNLDLLGLPTYPVNLGGLSSKYFS